MPLRAISYGSGFSSYVETRAARELSIANAERAQSHAHDTDNHDLQHTPFVAWPYVASAHAETENDIQLMHTEQTAGGYLLGGATILAIHLAR